MFIYEVLSLVALIALSWSLYKSERDVKARAAISEQQRVLVLALLEQLFIERSCGVFHTNSQSVHEALDFCRYTPRAEQLAQAFEHSPVGIGPTAQRMNFTS